MLRSLVGVQNASKSHFSLLGPLTIALASFLLFSIEPVVGKMALPWFGGSAEVWTGCLAFFQIALLFGYAHARVIDRQASTWQRRLHVVLLVISVGFVPTMYAVRWLR